MSLLEEAYIESIKNMIKKGSIFYIEYNNNQFDYYLDDFKLGHSDIIEYYGI